MGAGACRWDVAGVGLPGCVVFSNDPPESCDGRAEGVGAEACSWDVAGVGAPGCVVFCNEPPESRVVWCSLTIHQKGLHGRGQCGLLRKLSRGLGGEWEAWVPAPVS